MRRDAPTPGGNTGDLGGIDALLAAELPRLAAFVRLNAGAFLRQRESCSDLVQTVCKELLARRDAIEVRGADPFRNLLYTAALNKVRDRERYYRAARRAADREVKLDRGGGGAEEWLRCYASIASPSQHASAREQLELFERAFDTLPEHYREVITLARIAGQPHAAIAARLGKSEGAVRVLLARALARLASAMAELGA